MLLPSIFGEDLWDDLDNFFDFSSNRNQTSSSTLPTRAVADPTGLMRTDIRETETGYVLDVDLPGFDKSNVSAELKDGYLTISASRKDESNEKDDKGRFIRRERYYGNARRTFFVGEDVKQEDVHARYVDGILQVQVDKHPAQPKVSSTTIAIEG